MPSAYITSVEANSHSVQLRMSHGLIAEIDEWGQSEKMPSRSEAFRTLVRKGLEAAKQKKTA